MLSEPQSGCPVADHHRVRRGKARLRMSIVLLQRGGVPCFGAGRLSSIIGEGEGPNASVAYMPASRHEMARRMPGRCPGWWKGGSAPMCFQSSSVATLLQFSPRAVPRPDLPPFPVPFHRFQVLCQLPAAGFHAAPPALPSWLSHPLLPWARPPFMENIGR